MTFSGSGTPEISISYGDAGITFTPVNATGSGNMHMTASASAIAIGAVQNCSTLSQLTATGSNTATYANAFGTADLVYVLDSDALKEYIILEDSAAPNSFNFLFTLDGVTLQETETGAAFVNADGEAVFTLGSLFAVDVNGVPTDALTYTFQTVKNNIIGVTITLDPEYLAAADRAFPVVIDPTVMISSSSTADACVCSFTPSTNYQMAVQLRTGYDTDYGIRRSYIRFSIPDSIEVGSVTSAYLDIEKISGVAPTMRAYRVTGSWSSGTITWNNKPGYTTTHQSTQSVPYSSGSSWYRMNVTSIVNAWVNGEYINYGFVLVDSVENNSDHWTTLYSSDAASPHKPELYINYSGEEVTDPEPAPEPIETYHYIHYYDRSFSDDYESTILTVSNVASAAYMRQFSIAFSSSTPSVLNTLAGACPLGDQVPCSSSCTPHHKDVSANTIALNRMSGDGYGRVVYWADRSGNVYCRHEVDGNTEEEQCIPYTNNDEMIARVNRESYPKVIHFLDIPVSPDNTVEYEACMGITLIHETAHTLQLIDTNTNDPADHAEDGYQCVMEIHAGGEELISFYDAIIDGEVAFCKHCADMLRDLF